MHRRIDAGRSLRENHPRRFPLNRSKRCDPNASNAIGDRRGIHGEERVAEFADYTWLIEDEAAAAWLARLADDSRPALKQLDLLRRELPAERARLIVEQTELRRRAGTKFAGDASRMFFAPVLLEQATDRWIGRYKACRFQSAAPGALIHDYCCGFGGDLIALAQQNPCQGWDLSPLACLFASANVQATCDATAAQRTKVHQSNVEQLTPAPNEPWHFDPDRRATGRRSTTIDQHAPGPDTIDRWLAHSTSGAVKLAPATEPPAEWMQGAELEWITSHRECRQLVAWFGSLATSPSQRRATIVNTDDRNPEQLVTGTFAGEPDVPFTISDQTHSYLYDPDPSIMAAGLLGALADHHHLKSLGPGGAYLTGDQRFDDPLLQSFAVQDCLPLRPAAVAQHLGARGVGRVEIKKRGVTIDPEKFRRDLKLRGDREATVILTRIGKRQVAIIAQRTPTPQG